METRNVHVAGCWNDEDARGGIGVYWGPNDTRNFYDTCGNAVTDADSAGLDAVIQFLEQLGANSDCSKAPHDGNHFTIRTDNPNIVSWLTVNLPTWKEYDWEGDIPYRSLLSYIDALIENARVQASIEVSFLLVPYNREVAGQSGAISLAVRAGWAGTNDEEQEVTPEPDTRPLDERVYDVTLLELYTLSLQRFSPTSVLVDGALQRLWDSVCRLNAAARGDDATRRDDGSVSTVEEEEEEEEEEEVEEVEVEVEVEPLPTANDQDRRRQRTHSDTTQQRDAPEQPQTSSHSEYSAPVRSSTYYAAHPEVSNARNLGNLARICEWLIPDLEQSDFGWPQIPNALQLRILDALIGLLPDEDTNQEENGGKRKAVDDGSSSRPVKKQKVTESKAVPGTGRQKRNIVDHIDVDLESIANRLCDQNKKDVAALRIVFVVGEGDVLESLPLLNYLPHLVGAVNARRTKKFVKLVRLRVTERARKQLSEVWGIGRHDVFAIEQNECDMARLWGVLSSVPLVKCA